jgi:hypothetical protein
MEFTRPNQSVADMKSDEASAHPVNPANDPNLKEGLTNQAREAGTAVAEPRNGRAIR